jgi:hypothetical protein
VAGRAPMKIEDKNGDHQVHDAQRIASADA